MAAQLAANAPMSSDAKSHKAAYAEALRALSAASRAAVTNYLALACMRAKVSVTRFSASAAGSPVRCATSCPT